MQIHQMDESVRLHRVRTREAVALASQGRWAEAAEANRDILSQSPNEVEALNRLGKALSELGRCSEARDVFRQALSLDRTNPIARKNLERLAHLEDAPAVLQQERLAPRMFIEERGKSCVTTLWDPAPRSALARVAAGDTVALIVSAGTVRVTTLGGEPLGMLDPKLAARLVRLVSGRNRYVAAVASVRGGELAVILRELFQDPRLSGIVSFPARAGDMPPMDAAPQTGLRTGRDPAGERSLREGDESPAEGRKPTRARGVLRSLSERRRAEGYEQAR